VKANGLLLKGTELRYYFQNNLSLKKGYRLTRKLNRIYQHTKEKGFVFTKLTQWCNEVDQANIKSYNTIRRSIEHHYQNILNYFINRSTNASAESFNAKIKASRNQFRGGDVKSLLV